MKCYSYNVFFETISNKTRLKIVEALQKRPMAVSEICRALGEEQSKISHNLKALSDCHFLDVRKDGKKRIYSLNRDTVAPLMKLVDKHVKKYCRKSCARRDI